VVMTSDENSPSARTGYEIVDAVRSA
jgi:hypothetical protein